MRKKSSSNIIGLCFLSTTYNSVISAWTACTCHSPLWAFFLILCPTCMGGYFPLSNKTYRSCTTFITDLKKNATFLTASWANSYEFFAVQFFLFFFFTVSFYLCPTQVATQAIYNEANVSVLHEATYLNLNNFPKLTIVEYKDLSRTASSQYSSWVTAEKLLA